MGVTDNISSRAMVVAAWLNKMERIIAESRTELRPYYNLYYSVIVLAIRDAFNYRPDIRENCTTTVQQRCERNYHYRSRKKERDEAISWLQGEECKQLANLFMSKENCENFVRSFNRLVYDFNEEVRMIWNGPLSVKEKMKAANNLGKTVKRILKRVEH